jgi:tetratricopeptide (TPR) repeat protein
MKKSLITIMSLIGALVILTVIITSVVMVYNNRNNFGEGKFFSSTKKFNEIVKLFNTNELNEAVFVAEEELKKSDSDTNLMLLLATIYAQKGSLEFKEVEYGNKSLEISNKILAIDNENVEAYESMGYAYEIMEKYNDAINSYNKGIQINPNKTSLYVHKGHAYFLTNDIEKAIFNVDKALELDPTNTFALITKSKYIVDFFEKDLGSAEKMLHMVIKKSDEPNTRLMAEAYQLLGRIKIIQSSFDEAIKMYEKAIEIDKTLSSAWMGRAEAIYFSMQDNVENADTFLSKFQEAVDSIQKAIDINENNSMAYIVMAKILHLNTENDEVVTQVLKSASNVVAADVGLNEKQKGYVRDEIVELKSSWSIK